MPYQPYDYSSIDYRAWPPLQRFFRRIFVFLFRLLIQLEVEDLENIPRTGALLLAANHLDLLDAPLGLIFVPRRMVGFVKTKWRRPPINWLLEAISDVIYVDVGKPDRSALQETLKVLQAGGVVAVLPEGTRSRSGGLGQGHSGLALLATRAPAPILPVGFYGQEQAMKYWKRLKRVPIHARIGTLIELPAGNATKKQLQAYTDQVMIAIARLLPPEYRGVYAQLAWSSDQDEVLS